MKKLKFLLIILISCLFLMNCESNIDVDGDLDLTHDTKHVGMVEGKVQKAVLDEGRLNYVGAENFNVWIKKDGQTVIELKTVFDGLYSADELKTGTYEITTGNLIYWTYEKTSVTIRQQETSNVQTIKIKPKYGNSNCILYGKAYWNNGTLYANEELTWKGRSFDQHNATIRTSPSGDYAFGWYSDGYLMTSPEGDLIIEDIRGAMGGLCNFWSGYASSGFIKADVIVTPD